MRCVGLFLGMVVLVAFSGCGSNDGGGMETDVEYFSGTVTILDSWHGEYPVSRLTLFPLRQKDAGIGVITDEMVFANIWQAFKPDMDPPEVDFDGNVVLFQRNTRYYNRVRIGQVKARNGIVEILAMETMSAIPVEDKVAMSLAVIEREGIRGVRQSSVDVLYLD